MQKDFLQTAKKRETKMAEKKNETDHSPKNLAARITHKGDLDLNAVRDAIAAVLPRRWSEFALALEKMRFKNMQTSNSTIKGSVEDWVLRHTFGRAFYHYMFVTYFTKNVTPTPKGFASFFEHEPLIHTYYRMFNEWRERNWCDEEGIPCDDLILTHAELTFEIMEIEQTQKILPHGVSYLQSKRNRTSNEFLF